MKNKKSKAVKKVLSLMDAECTYTEALKIALIGNKRIKRQRLEKTLTKYI